MADNSSVKPTVTVDLIDFSSSSGEEFMTSSSMSSQFQDFSTNVMSIGNQDTANDSFTNGNTKALSLEDYVRKPRTYSRERAPSNEERPPPLPPKRRSQSRKNQKLNNRLVSAGIKVEDETSQEQSLGTTQGQSSGTTQQQSSGTTQQQSLDSFATISSLDLSVFDESFSVQASQSGRKFEASNSHVAFDNFGSRHGNISFPATSSLSAVPKSSSKSTFPGMSKLRETQSFESRLKDVMSQKDVDLIRQNLVEFEVSSKPQESMLPQKTASVLVPRSSSWESLLSVPSKSSVTSLSIEDLETFMNENKGAGDEKQEGLAYRAHINSPQNFPTQENDANLNDWSVLDKESGLQRTKTLPPPRPPPPKSFNRFSLPVDFNSSAVQNTKLYFGDGIFDLTDERNEEAIAFCDSVADVRKFYKYENSDTNPGFVSDSVTQWKQVTPSKLLDVEVFYEKDSNYRKIKCDMFTNVQDVVSMSLLAFQDKYREIDVISKNWYIFKICGESCYLEGNEPFINYRYVQNCVKMGEQIRLMVLPRAKIERDLSRTAEDDNQESSGIYFKQFFDIRSTTSISRQGLAVLIETYNCEVAKLLSSVSRSSNPSYVPEKLIQIVKALSLSLAYIETSQIHEAVNLLLSLKPKAKDTIVHIPSEPGVVDFNRIISPDTFDKGRFNLALSKLTSAIYAMIDAYCRAFDTDFAIHNPEGSVAESPRDQYHSNERMRSDSVNDNLSLRISSVHRIPTDWKVKFDYFEVEAGIFYGGTLLCKQVLTKLSKPSKGFYEHIRWDEIIKFDMKVKEIPREARLCLGLYGLNSARKQPVDSKFRNELGWIAVNLFNFKGLLISGSHLFGLVSGTEMNPAATCSSNNIQEASSVILKADFEVYHTDVIFPEPLVQTANSISDIACSSEVLLKLEEILSKRTHMEVSKEEKEIIWKNRLDLRNTPRALPYVLSSMPNLKAHTATATQELLSMWKPLPPNIALGLLTADFPDIVTREYAVKWFSTVNESELCDYLPQLVQALKYESYHKSALAKYLISSALKSPKVALYLFWHLKYYTADAQFSLRFQIVLGGVLGVCGTALKDQLSRQDQVVQLLSLTTKKVKEARDNTRRTVLNEELDSITANMEGNLRLPVNPSVKVKSLDNESCSYFNSFTVPLSLVFENCDPRGKTVKSMFKIGDDLRKDLITLQLFRVMDRLWLAEGLDLKMVTYECIPTSPLSGMVQLVPNASTLREIHVQHGVTGSFKDNVISLWLQRYNQSEGEYQVAVDNFSASCAAYCVATYVLGIGDRHNDNIMVTQRGHLFHIDFSKFMGNVQKFGTIRRDRVPFVLTPDMAYVINFGEATSYNFQHFVELCCGAFNVIRKNSELILNLLGLMVSSGIPYLSSANDIDYVRHALQLHLSNAEATVFFTRLIETSLSSKSTQWNFFIHNMAHMKDSQSVTSTARAIFSFSNKVYSKESDGQIVSVRCVDIQKRYVPEKHYIFVINVLRDDNSDPKFIFRKYDEFQELQTKLSHVFGSSAVPSLPGRVLVGRSEIRDIAMKRRNELDSFLVEILKSDLLSNSEIMYTFLHSYIRDEQDSVKFADILFQLENGMPRSRVGGEIKLSYQYRHGRLNILVMHARNLVPRSVQGTADPYVKSYLLPDPNKATKQKTRIAKKNLNPTYNQTLSYAMSLEELQSRTLQVTVWDSDSVGVNDYLGGVNCYLSTHDLTKEVTQWFQLRDLELGM